MSMGMNDPIFEVVWQDDDTYYSIYCTTDKDEAESWISQAKRIYDALDIRQFDDNGEELPQINELRARFWEFLVSRNDIFEQCTLDEINLDLLEIKELDIVGGFVQLELLEMKIKDLR